MGEPKKVGAEEQIRIRLRKHLSQKEYMGGQACIT